MGKIRAVKLGDEELELESRRRADARRETKKHKKTPFEKPQGKQRIEGVGLHGGERTAVVEGTTIKPEYKKLIDEVESAEKAHTEGTKSKKEKVKPVLVHTRSKKYKKAAGMVDKTKLYPLPEAITIVKKTSMTKFDGTVEIHINLNLQSMGDKKDVRGTVILPHGTGKSVNVQVADDKILAEVAAGKINFDILVAHPSMMPKLAKVAKILGPKGLMPNPKNGTVTTDTDKKVKELSTGHVNYKSEPNNPIIHMSVGKVSFDDKKLSDNISTVLDAVGRTKITKVTLASSMGPGVKVNLS